MYSLTTFILTIFSFAAFLPAQEKEFLDKHHSPTTEEKAVYYRICKRDDLKRLQGKVRIYRINASIYSEMGYVDGLRDGYYSSYHANGNLATKGLYEADNRLGLWESWYDNHQKQKDETYSNKGALKIENYWDRNGKQLMKSGTGFYEFINETETITEKGNFKNYQKDGAWIGYYDDGKMYFQEQWLTGKLIQGHSHDAAGKIYSYTEAEYHTLPTYTQGMTELAKFLNKTIKYPREAQQAHVEGKISVKFLVDIDGSIKEAQVINSITYLNEEALRIIRSMPAWKPSMLRGQTIPSTTVLPITFKLH